MLRLGFPEWSDRLHFRHHLTRPQSRCLDIGDRVERSPLLLFALVEDRRAVAHPDVISLTIFRRRVMNLEKELEQLAIADLRRIENYFDRLGVGAMVAISRIRYVAARVAD